MNFQEATRPLRDALESNGFPVFMYSEYCNDYKEKHGSCAGCEKEIGCNKYLKLIALNQTAMLYKPKDFNDHLEMIKKIKKESKKILEIME